MELDRALELAVTSSWDELVKPGEIRSIHVEYKNVSGLPLSLIEVWSIRKRGYGTLAFRYVVPPADSTTAHLEDAMMSFTNSYHSDTLASNLDFIMRNQKEFTRPIDHSVHGLVQIETPSEEDKKEQAGVCGAIPCKKGRRVGRRLDEPNHVALLSLFYDGCQARPPSGPGDS